MTISDAVGSGMKDSIDRIRVSVGRHILPEGCPTSTWCYLFQLHLHVQNGQLIWNKFILWCGKFPTNTVLCITLQEILWTEMSFSKRSAAIVIANSVLAGRRYLFVLLGTYLIASQRALSRNVFLRSNSVHQTTYSFTEVVAPHQDILIKTSGSSSTCVVLHLIRVFLFILIVAALLKIIS